MKFIDFRSDTVTEPTPEMLDAMSNALVGDDIYGDDPTVNKLQEIAARVMGKEKYPPLQEQTFAKKKVAFLSELV